ncbi:MAG: BspA family leucine-rich repeat surface protein [Clostridia bacterium]|nr:BspA family leucine-rich repeat surface protein [Clostridia bacterium]
MKNNKGITLVSLVITIIVLLILASVFIYSGVNTVRYTKYNKAKSEISVVQTNVNSWYQELKNVENTDEYKALQTEDEKKQYKNNFLDDKGYGVTTDDPACSQKKLDDTLQGLNDKGIEIENFDNYRFLSSKFLENKLGLNASYDYLANIEDRTVILFGGLEYNGEWYYTMEDFGLTNIKSTMPNSVSFELKQEDIASTDIIIYNLVFTDANGNPFEVSKFNTYISETGKNEWVDISSKVSKTTYNNATAFRISNNLEHKSYDVKIETIDKNLKSELVTVAIEEPRAIFKTGAEVNAKMKQLAGTENATHQTEDTNIREIKRATEISDANKIDSNIVSTPESNTPIYMWFDNGIIYYYSIDEKPELNTASSYMFSGFKKLKNIYLNNFDTSNVTLMHGFFERDKELTNLDLSSLNTSKVTNMGYMFNGCTSLENINLSNFNTEKATTMNGMFNGCAALKTLDLSGFNTSNVTSMAIMFQDCKGLTSLDLTKFNTSNVTSMGKMFQGCSELISIDFSEFDTRKVDDMSNMFTWCRKLTSLDLSKFDTSKVTNMQSMFYDCNNLIQLNIGEKFTTSNVTTMRNMFFGCRSLTSLELNSFNTSKVTDMSYMFGDCNNLIQLDIGNFNTSNVTDMYKMFSGCNKITKIYASNDFVTDKFEKGVDINGKEVDSREMFRDCNELIGGSGTTYNVANVDKTYAHIDGGTSNPGYFTAK